MIKALVIVILTTAIVLWLNTQSGRLIKQILKWFPAVLFAYVIPAIITHSTGWDLSDVYLHTISRDWIIPAAILTVMSALSLTQLKIIGARPILLFVAGSCVIAILPVILVMIAGGLDESYYVLFIENEYWKGLVPIVGGWIGGSTSQLILKELVDCPEALFFAILVLDNILVNIWTILMFQLIQRSEGLNKFFGIKDEVPDFVADEVHLGRKEFGTVVGMIASIIVILLVGNWIVTSFLWRVVMYSLIGLALGNFLKFWRHDVVLKIGGVLIVLIMAILGLRLNFGNMSLPVVVIVVVCIWLILHFVVMMLVARMLKLHMAWVPIASMANLGGISTAPAVTAAYNEEWMPHAILLAILSMVTGTAWGFLTIYLFGLL